MVFMDLYWVGICSSYMEPFASLLLFSAQSSEAAQKGDSSELTEEGYSFKGSIADL